MKKGLIRLWNARPRLRRGQKLALNLGLCSLILLWLWGIAGYPLPTAELEFRRMERQNLVPPSEIVFAPSAYRSNLAISREDRTFTAEDGTELNMAGQWFVGVLEDRAVIAQVGNTQWDRRFRTVPLAEEGPTLLSFNDSSRPAVYGYWVEEGPTPSGYRYNYHNFVPLLVLNVPEEAARLAVSVRDETEIPWTGTGWDLGGGVWLAGIEREVRGTGWYLDRPYTLRLYAPDGSLLAEQSGTIPK